jgi:hypothetical protein
MKTSSEKRNLEPEQPKSLPVPLESLEDIAWELQKGDAGPIGWWQSALARRRLLA